MKKKKQGVNKRDIQKIHSSAQFVRKLRSLADKLEAGENFSLQVAGERIYVPMRKELSIEHERDGEMQEIEFQLKWKLEPEKGELKKLKARKRGK